VLVVGDTQYNNKKSKPSQLSALLLRRQRRSEFAASSVAAWSVARRCLETPCSNILLPPSSPSVQHTINFARRAEQQQRLRPRLRLDSIGDYNSVVRNRRRSLSFDSCAYCDSLAENSSEKSHTNNSKETATATFFLFFAIFPMLVGYALHAIPLNLDTAGVAVAVAFAAAFSSSTKRTAAAATITRTRTTAATLSPCRQHRSIASPLDSPCTTTTTTTTAAAGAAATTTAATTTLTPT